MSVWQPPGQPQAPAAMPNGYGEPHDWHREPFRAGGGAWPSPVHTSDSEDTWDNKTLAWGRARRVFLKWLLFARRKRGRREMARRLKLCMPKSLPESALPLVAEFLFKVPWPERPPHLAWWP